MKPSGLSKAKRVRRGFLTVFAAALVLPLAMAIRDGRADDDTARAAFENGDYDRAEAEWRPLAEQSAMAGEFGMGEVYEQGRADYRTAARWYEKAAEHGSTEARYRLALIALAGNRDIGSDPIEAYKWALLAADSKDTWGQLAQDLRQILDKHITPVLQAEGTARAAAWRQAHQASPAAPDDAVRAFLESIKSMDCASLRVAQSMGDPAAALAGSPSLDAPRLRSGAVAAMGPALHPTLRVYGTIPGEVERARLMEAAQRVPPQVPLDIHVEVMPPPLCRFLKQFDELAAAGLAQNLDARLLSAGATLREGDSIEIDVKGTAFPLYLRVDYFAFGGQVHHMLKDRQLPAGAGEVLGTGSWFVGGEPFGTEFISVAATPEPLDLGERRSSEDASTYVRDLSRALRTAKPPTQRSSFLATIIVHTAPR